MIRICYVVDVFSCAILYPLKKTLISHFFKLPWDNKGNLKLDIYQQFKLKDGNPSVGLHFFTILLIFPMSHVSHMLQGLMTSNLISSKFILSSRLITLQCCMSYTETRTHSSKFVIIMHYKKYNARNLRDFQTKIHHVTNERKTMCDACYSEIRPAPPMSLSPITRYAYLRGGGLSNISRN